MESHRNITPEMQAGLRAGYTRLWFQSKADNVVCHYDVKTGVFIGFNGQRLDFTLDTFPFEQFRYKTPDARCVPC